MNVPAKFKSVEVSAGMVPYPLLKTLQVRYRISSATGMGFMVIFLQPCNRELSVMPQMRLPYRRPISVHFLLNLQLFGSSANIQQWASPFTAGVSWLSRPDQLTRLQTTST